MIASLSRAAVGLVVLTFASTAGDGRARHPPRRQVPGAQVAPASASGAAPLRPLRAAATRPAPVVAAGAPSLDAAWSRRARRAHDDFEAYSRYPPWSRPLSEHAELSVPHRVEPTAVPLADDEGESTGVVLQLVQSRLFTVPGDRVRLEVHATRDGRPVAARADWGSVRLDGRLLPVETSPLAGDGSVASAELRLDESAVAGVAGKVTVEAEVTAAGEAGSVAFVVVHTGAPPARVEAVVGDSIEEGSLRIDLAIEVARAGHYQLVGRLDDATGRPVALLRFTAGLEAGHQQVPLRAHGRLLRDEDAVPPWTLRDVEGFRLVPGGHPDREVMAIWSGPYRTESRSMDALTDEGWDSPGRRARLAALEGFIAHEAGSTPAP
jgi:hypothetical protein